MIDDAIKADVVENPANCLSGSAVDKCLYLGLDLK